MKTIPVSPDAHRARRNLLIVVVFASALGLAVLWLTGWFARQPGFLFEVVFYPFLAATLASIPVIREEILRLPRLYRGWLLALVGFAVVAQFLGGGGDLFPGARWAMFSDNVPSPTANLLVIEFDDGRVEQLDATELYGSLRNGRAGSLLGRLGIAEAEELLLSYATRVQDLQPDAQVTSISLVEARTEEAEELRGPATILPLIEVRP